MVEQRIHKPRVVGSSPILAILCCFTPEYCVAGAVGVTHQPWLKFFLVYGLVGQRHILRVAALVRNPPNRGVTQATELRQPSPFALHLIRA